MWQFHLPWEMIEAGWFSDGGHAQKCRMDLSSGCAPHASWIHQAILPSSGTIGPVQQLPRCGGMWTNLLGGDYTLALLNCIKLVSSQVLQDIGCARRPMYFYTLNLARTAEAKMHAKVTLR